MLLSGPQSREDELREIEIGVNILKQIRHHHIAQLVTTYLFRDNYAIILKPRADGNLEQCLQTANNPPSNLGHQAREQISRWFGC